MTFLEEHASFRASVHVQIESFLDMELALTDASYEKMIIIVHELRAQGYDDELDIFAKMIRILPQANLDEIANAIRDATGKVTCDCTY